MIKKTVTTLFMVMAFVTFGYAQDITGNWKGTVNDQFEINYTFKVEGEKLTGASKGPDGSDRPISNGVIKGEDLSFSIDIMGNPIQIKGKIKGSDADKTKAETIQLFFTINGNDVTLVLSPVK
ncbi:hypothetical protein [Flavobacterium eburneipallidum]|uniref:hypothetical protein n=1 Tax=Flavobacterium eburneipallidum TaxID=3003263 RepID=UPI0024827F9A|nr:hypothetical protein [Flavobacterium eburneipallidum]